VNQPTPNIAPLQAKLAPIYRPGREWSYEECCRLVEIMRGPHAMEEAQQIVDYFETLPSHRKQYFPHSMVKLLARWNELLDEIAMNKVVSREQPLSGAAQVIHWHKELGRIEKRMKSIKDSYSEHQNWDAEHRAEFPKLKARRAELIKLLGMTT
jgi:hypothetical protein